MQNRTGILLRALVGLMLVALPAVAGAEEHGLLELYQLAKAKDPSVGRSAAKLEVGKADQQIAWSAVLPDVSANASQRWFWHTVLNYNPKTIEGSYDGYNYSLTAQLPVVNVPAWYQIAAADAGVVGAEAGTDISRQDLLLRLLNGYVTLLKVQNDVSLLREELSRIGEIYKQAEAFLKAGTGDIISVYEAKARMESATADLIKAEAQKRVAEQTLSGLTGVAVTMIKNIRITTPFTPQPADLEWWLDTMRKQNPALRQSQEELRQAALNHSTAWAGHLPTVQMQGGYTVDKGSTFLPNVETRQWYVGASISVPIFSGGETMARTRRAAAAESERRFILEDIKDENTKRLKEAFLNVQHNVSLTEAYRRKLESTQLQQAATRKGREIGTRTAIDLLNAEQAYSTARRDLSNALYDNLLRNFELKSAAGILTEEDLNQIAVLAP